MWESARLRKRLQERLTKAAAVRVWHEFKAHAAGVARVAQELAGHVRTWLERAADHVLDRMQPPETGLLRSIAAHPVNRIMLQSRALLIGQTLRPM
jgi:hypothetical protein